MSQRISKWRDTRAMTVRLTEQRRESDERIDAAEMAKPLTIPAGMRVIGVATTDLPWHAMRIDVTLAPSGEVITRAGNPSDIYQMSLQAAAMMQEATQS